MSPPIELVFESALAAPAEQVWAAATSPEGINHELGPLVRMTVPAGVVLDAARVPIGEPLGVSWVLAFGFLPLERMHLVIAEFGPGFRFLESSRVAVQRTWRHERIVEPVASGCVVRDQLTFEPRVALMRPFVTAIVRRLFEHRHARLRRRFGAA
jgi:ligand-binding SRPBCC domain-containing protein